LLAKIGDSGKGCVVTMSCVDGNRDGTCGNPAYPSNDVLTDYSTIDSYLQKINGSRLLHSPAQQPLNACGMVAAAASARSHAGLDLASSLMMDPINVEACHAHASGWHYSVLQPCDRVRVWGLCSHGSSIAHLLHGRHAIVEHPSDNGQFRLSILSDEGSTIGCSVLIDVNCVLPADVAAGEYSGIFFDAEQVRDMTNFFSQGKSKDEVWETDQSRAGPGRPWLFRMRGRERRGGSSGGPSTGPWAALKG